MIKPPKLRACFPFSCSQLLQVLQQHSIRRLTVLLSVLLLVCVPVSSIYAADEDNSWEDDKGIIVIVGDPYVELYLFPGRGYARFHAIEKNEKIRLYKSRGNWYKIETQDGKIGWVPRRNLHTLYDLEGNLLDFSMPSWGETKKPWQLGLMAGRTEDALSYSIITGYQFTPNITVELNFTQTFGDFYNLKHGSLRAVHQPFSSWRFSPFFTWGAGVIKTFPHSTVVIPEDAEDAALTVGGGLMIYLTHNILARIEYNSHTILTTRDNNEEVEEWKAGFSVLF